MCKFSANVLFSYLKPLLFSFPLNSAHHKIISQILLGGGGVATKIAKDSGDSFAEQNSQRGVLLHLRAD